MTSGINEAALGQKRIEIAARNARGDGDDASFLVKLDEFVFPEFNKNGFVTHAPNSPGMAARAYGNSTVVLLGELNGFDKVLFLGYLDHGLGKSLWSSLIENPTNTGFFVIF